MSTSNSHVEMTSPLDEKYLSKGGSVFLSGSQTFVRLMLLQAQRDREAGFNTGGFVSGYRGSPLGGIDQAFQKAKSILQPAKVFFQAGLNEDLAATSIWGTQQVGLFPGAKVDGVFSLWYGKGPGVDRCGDVFKHANAAGSSPRGGVLILAGDDHAAKSSTIPHQSDHALKAALIPVLYPSSLQEYLDFGLHGFAMSRWTGLWVGMKCVTDIVESSGRVDVSPIRVDPLLPADFKLPPDGLNIRWPDTPLAQEARLLDYKIYAALAYARLNQLNQTVIETKNARLGIISAGKAYLDTRQALLDLGLDDSICSALGIRVLKVGMVWPLEPEGIRKFAEGLEEILVVEEKRQLLEYQIKEELYNWREDVRPRVLGKFDEKDGGEWAVPQGNWLLPQHYELDPVMIARAIASRLERFNLPEAIRRSIDQRLSEIKRGHVVPERSGALNVVRKPYFCSGCPHNSSTKVPEGSRATAGIGCHYMAIWMNRNTSTFTQMGGEGTPWIGQAPFTSERHIFANLGDGTYYHSGYLAIRASVAAGVNITYKILFNDAVAMTGGQAFDGPLSVQAVARQVLAEGARRVVLVSDNPQKHLADRSLPREVEIHGRNELEAVQISLRETAGTSILIYEQTCAAEKRRRRKRKTFPDRPKRYVIHPSVCEGCGDCSKESNCLSVEPLETPLGRKRKINQSTCNKDYSCVQGYCPSFIELDNVRVRQKTPSNQRPPDVPEPSTPSLTNPLRILITGVGGTGVVTIGALLGMSAHLEGMNVVVLDMAGLAQKGGAVFTHVQIAPPGVALYATRVSQAQADLILGCDLIVAASEECLSKTRAGSTRVVVNAGITPTADFIHDRKWTVDDSALIAQVANQVGDDKVHAFSAHLASEILLGDTLFSNSMVLGFAWQMGWIPFSRETLFKSFEINGAAVDANIEAFQWGRFAAHSPDAFHRYLTGHTSTPEAEGASGLAAAIETRVRYLTEYQDAHWAERYRARVEQIAQIEEERLGSDELTQAVANQLFRLMSYKDEYEVARLLGDPDAWQSLLNGFEPVDPARPITAHLNVAPSWWGSPDSRGRHPKRRLSAKILPLLRLLARGKRFRGSRWDPFGYTAERKAERDALRQFERLLDEIGLELHKENHALAVTLVNTADQIRGFGPVKRANLHAALAQWDSLMPRWRKLQDGTHVEH